MHFIDLCQEREQLLCENLIGPYLRTWDGESPRGTQMPFKEQAEPLPAPGVPLCEYTQGAPSSRTSQPDAQEQSC